MTKHSRDEDFLQEFQDLSVRAQIHTRGTRQVSVPTWGQLKKLTQEGNALFDKQAKCGHLCPSFWR